MSCRSTGISTCSLPSKRWSTGVSPWPPVTSTAGAPSSTSRSASSRLAARRGPRALRPRAGSASPPSRAGRAARRASSTASALEQRRARARHHHRIDDERHRMPLEVVGDRLDQPREKSIPVFAASTPMSDEDRVELGDDELRRQLVDRRHRRRVLRRQGDQSRHAVGAGGGERLQVGLDPGAAAAVGRRNASRPSELTGSSLRRHDPDQVRRV